MNGQRSLRPGRLLVATIAVLGLASGCGESSGASPTVPITDTTVGHPSVITDHGPLGAGTYRIDLTAPRTEITLDADGWYAGRPSAQFNALNLYPSDPDAYVLFFRPEAVYDDDDTNPDPVPTDLAAWLRARPALTVGRAIEVALDDRPALRFDATVTAPDRTCDLGDRTRVRCTVLAPVPGNEPLRFAAGDRVRFWVLDVEGPLLIAVTHRGDRFESFVGTGAAVVESVHFLDG
jgi:hypothetical protein